MRGSELIKCKCGRMMQAWRDQCSICAKGEENRSLKVNKKPKPYVPKQMTDHETIQSLAYLAHKLVDLGSSGPVTHYTPGHPKFQELAAMYGGAR